MSVSSNYFALYSAMGEVYIRWTCCSILSALDEGQWKGEIGVVVSNEIEKDIITRLFPEVWCHNVDYQVAEHLPKFIFKPHSLAKIPEGIIPQKENVLFLDCDCYFSDNADSFLETVSDQFWVEKIYPKRKAARYSAILDESLARENISLSDSLYEFNSGCWSIPTGRFHEFVQTWSTLVERYHENEEVLYLWTDQVFFAPAAVKLGLEPTVVDEYNAPDTVHSVLHTNKGFTHVSGDWRTHKLYWKLYLKQSGLEKRLKLLSKERLTPDQYRRLWESDFVRDQVMGKSARLSEADQVARKRKTMKLIFRAYVSYWIKEALRKLGLLEKVKKLVGR